MQFWNIEKHNTAVKSEKHSQKLSLVLLGVPPNVEFNCRKQI